MSDTPDSQTTDHIAADATRLLFAGPWTFVMGAPSVATLPPAGPAEVAFAGRSNVGKSSLINALVGQKALARTSNTPGRTQEMNFFIPGDGAGPAAGPPPIVIVDMPGYGFAKAPHAKVKAWTGMIRHYLAGRVTLARVFLLIDARHGIKPADEEVMALLDKAAVVYQAVLTKADKLKPGEIAALVERTAELLRKRPAAHPAVIVTSSKTGDGLDALRAEIASLAAIH